MPSGFQTSAPRSTTFGGHIDALFHTLVLPACNLMPAPASIFSSSTLYIGRVRPGGLTT